MHDSIDGHFDAAIIGGHGLHRWIRRQATIVVNGSRLFLPVPATLAGPLLEWGLNWCIERSAHKWVVVHAAVVAREGQALILPAPPGSGKSTLCAALAFSGWQLFSDELALIDPETGRVLPIPRPLSLKEGSIEVIRGRYPEVVFGPEGHDVEGERFVHARPPSESVRRAGESARPAWIISPSYVPGAATTFEPVPKAQALMQFADQSFNYNYLGAKGYQCLAEAVRQADTYNLEYSDLDDVLAQLARLTPP
jgi:HprK-related kinase A